MAEFEFTERDATLIAACLSAATAIVVARYLQAGIEPEKLIADRAYKIYEATLRRFELPDRSPLRSAETLELVAHLGGIRKSG